MKKLFSTQIENAKKTRFSASRFYTFYCFPGRIPVDPPRKKLWKFLNDTNIQFYDEKIGRIIFGVTWEEKCAKFWKIYIWAKSWKLAKFDFRYDFFHFSSSTLPKNRSCEFLSPKIWCGTLLHTSRPKNTWKIFFGGQ